MIDYSIYDSQFAVCNLLGKRINGWNVHTALPKPDPNKGETGGNFSICYLCEKDGEECFMKVFDMRVAIFSQLPVGVTRMELIQRRTTEFNYEKKLSLYCKNKRIRNVIGYRDAGDINLPEYPFGDVSYIVYEKAEGDVRKTLDLTKKAVFLEKLEALNNKIKSLHEVAVGIQQLHSNEISHQDLKPSNVLSINNESKIGDLGRSLCLNPDIDCPYPPIFLGDSSYAPPEACFRYFISDEKERLYQMDNYMLGSLVVFYISGVTFSALMNNHLNAPIWQLHLHGLTYEGAMADMVNAYHNAILDFEKDIPLDDIKTDLVRIVQYLCHPDVQRRGHPKNLSRGVRTPNYDLTRTVKELDVIRRKTELGLYKK